PVLDPHTVATSIAGAGALRAAAACSFHPTAGPAVWRPDEPDPDEQAATTVTTRRVRATRRRVVVSRRGRSTEHRGAAGRDAHLRRGARSDPGGHGRPAA